MTKPGNHAEMSYVSAIVWGGSQLAAVLMSKEILSKLVTLSGAALYRRLESSSSSRKDTKVLDVQAELARVTTLLHEAGVMTMEISGNKDDWQTLDVWEIALSQPGDLQEHARLFRNAHPRDMAAWQLRESLIAATHEFNKKRGCDPNRLRHHLKTMKSRTEALLALWHTAPPHAGGSED